MRTLINRMMGAVKHFTPVDFAIFKIYIFAVGVLAGAYGFFFWADYIAVVWGVVLLFGVYTVGKLIHYAQKK